MLYFNGSKYVFVYEYVLCVDSPFFVLSCSHSNVTYSEMKCALK